MAKRQSGRNRGGVYEWLAPYWGYNYSYTINPGGTWTATLLGFLPQSAPVTTPPAIQMCEVTEVRAKLFLFTSESTTFTGTNLLNCGLDVFDYDQNTITWAYEDTNTPGAAARRSWMHIDSMVSMGTLNNSAVAAAPFNSVQLPCFHINWKGRRTVHSLQGLTLQIDSSSTNLDNVTVYPYVRVKYTRID